MREKIVIGHSRPMFIGCTEVPSEWAVLNPTGREKRPQQVFFSFLHVGIGWERPGDMGWARPHILLY